MNLGKFIIQLETILNCGTVTAKNIELRLVFTSLISRRHICPAGHSRVACGWPAGQPFIMRRVANLEGFAISLNSYHLDDIEEGLPSSIRILFRY
jgi:hypothetical protein